MPLIARAGKAAGRPISMMLTPWSPPAFMKTNNEKNRGGSLKEEYYGLWASYICRYIREYRSRGVSVTTLSVQNEPKAVQLWDSCIFTPEQERRFLRDHLAPAMDRAGLGDMDVLIWDHNKERVFERACEVINDAEMERIVAGVGVHWYSGDHFEALELIRQRFPGKRIVFTEACVEYGVVKEQGQFHNAAMYAHDIIGDLNAGMDTFLDWNIVLDKEGGPNHAGNYCDAPILCDTQAGTWRKNLSYHFIGHFSRYLRPGARRIGFSRYTGRLEVTAFQNMDGKIAAVVFNPGEDAEAYHLRLDEQVCALEAPPHSIATHIITK